MNRSKSSGILSSLIVCIILIITASFFFIYRQRIIDQIAVWQFKPSSQITGLVDRAGMNDNGKFYYFASKPKLDATQTFNSECSRVEKTTSILGCYNGANIFIYDVTDSQLDGIREVTATHETLHAIYLRLSNDAKTRVNKLVEAEYAKLASNSDYKELIAFYDRTEPGQRDNELHSIIGTEVANISPELETYYDQYFSDRKKVVDLDVKYSSVFKGLKARADELTSQMNTLSTSITSRTNDYNNATKTLNNDISSFNSKASSGGFSSMSQFNYERNLLSVRASNLDDLRNSINADINKYQALLDEYNSIASESTKLYNVIDSTLAPAPSI